MTAKRAKQSAFAQELVQQVHAKFKRPSVIHALLGLPKKSLGKVGQVQRQEIRLPQSWVGRYAEILDHDPQLTIRRFIDEAVPTRSNEIDQALSAYPLADSNHLPPKIPAQNPFAALKATAKTPAKPATKNGTLHLKRSRRKRTNPL